jgi:hypothetical protein
MMISGIPGIRPVFVDNSYLKIIEGAYGYHRHQWESLAGRRRSLNWSDSCSHVTERECCIQQSLNLTLEFQAMDINL